MIVTAHGQSDWEGVALDRGADAFLEKPFRINELVDAVAALLETGRTAVSNEAD
jgi:DNA-binding response OmpR family regulator